MALLRWGPVVLALLPAAMAGGCGGCSGDDDPVADGGAGDGASRRDGEVPTMDGAVPLRDGETPTMDGAVPLRDGEIPAMDGAVPAMDGALPDGAIPRTDAGCAPVQCQAHTYRCGDCLDNDSDGLADSWDPDCLGPCDNNEAGFYLGIAGGDSAPCKLDCYYDQDQGSGNDDCRWDSRCDPLEPDWDPRGCAYRDPPPASAECPPTQSMMCHDFCGPLTPNGCDCFGCCELPARSGRYVFIGSTDAAGVPTCSLDVMLDDTRCHPCTPVGDCLNTCGRCELCLGRTELPPECFPPPPVDAGPRPDGAMPVDGGPRPDGYVPTDGGPPPPPRCPSGVQACGLPGDPVCPAGYWCITGCCQYFG